MAKVVIFGVKDFAELAHFYLTHDSEHEVVAFTVNREYLPDPGTFRGLPVLPFEDLLEFYPPEHYSIFAPMSSRGMNQPRVNVYQKCREMGYSLISYVSSKATIFPESPIGDNCFILEDNTIQPFTSIGNNVILWSGNHIGHHGKVEDHVFFTSHVVMSGHCVIGASSFLGVNATLKDNIKLGEGTLVAMGTVLGSDTDPWSVWRGNPGRKSEISSKDVNV
jgi:sugar O-acyltransferase (sialic acid O-acetyltransferase NeuD family)